MKTAAPASAAASESRWDQHARRLDFLHRLAGAGMAKARALVAQVTGHIAARIAEDFERIAKAIRLAILLRRRLEEEGPGLAAAPAAPATPAPAEAPDPPELHEPAELGQGPASPAGADREIREATGDPWLDRDDDLELDQMPVAVLVQRLCEILGVDYDADLWADATAPIGAGGSPVGAAIRPAAGRTVWREPPARPMRSAADPRRRPSPSG